MRWIDIENCNLTIADTTVELEMRISGTYHAAVKGVRDYGSPIEPAEPESFEVFSVEYRPTRYNKDTEVYETTAKWTEFPASLLLPAHMASIVHQACWAIADEIAEADARRKGSTNATFP